MHKFVLIEPCNFEDYPIGGQLSFAKQLMDVFGNQLALVGYGALTDPVGSWFKKEINGSVYDYFAICKKSAKENKPIVPLRIQNLFFFYRYRIKIADFTSQNWFIQAPEILIAAKKQKQSSICYMFPGVENPLKKPRYRWGKIFANYFNQRFIDVVNQSDVLLACADDAAIASFIEKNKHQLTRTDIIKFPTRYHSEIFYPIDLLTARKKLGLPEHKRIILTSGRINKVKGWRLILDAFVEYQKQDADSLLVFVGDGEEKAQLAQQIELLGLSDKVKITGFLPADSVSLYLNSADVYLVGSENEGWSIAMLEALACGKSIVSTNISGATTLIEHAGNGYVIKSRNPELYATMIAKSLHLPRASEISVKIAAQYQLNGLKQAILAQWKILD